MCPRYYSGFLLMWYWICLSSNLAGETKVIFVVMFNLFPSDRGEQSDQGSYLH